MADLDRIKKNVAKMASMNAPMEDIDGYISSEGVTIDQVRAHKLSGGVSVLPSFDQAPAEIPTTPGGLVADIAGGTLEAPTAVLGSFIAPIGGGIAATGGAIGTALAGGGLDEIAKIAKEYFGKGQEKTQIALGMSPETQSGQLLQENLGHLFEQGIKGIGWTYEKAKQFLDKTALEYVKEGGELSPEKYNDLLNRISIKSGSARSLVEGGAETAALVGGIRGTVPFIKSRTTELKDRFIKKPIPEVTPKPEPGPTPKYVYQPDLLMEEARSRGQDLMAQRRAAAMGELETIGEQQRFLNRELTGQQELFGEPFQQPGRATMREDFGRGSGEAAMAAIEGQTPNLYPRTTPTSTLESVARSETPPQLEKMNRASHELPPNPEQPFYGDPRVGLTRVPPETRFDLSRTPVNEQPITPTERGAIRAAPGEIGRPERTFSPTPGEVPTAFTEGMPNTVTRSGWQTADPRIAERISRDSILKEMETRLQNITKVLEGTKNQMTQLKIERDSASVRFGAEGQRPGQYGYWGKQFQKYDKQVKALEKSIAAQTRDAEALKNRINDRVANHEAKVRGTPVFEKTSTPYLGRPKGRGNKQSGVLLLGEIYAGVNILKGRIKKLLQSPSPKKTSGQIKYEDQQRLYRAQQQLEEMTKAAPKVRSNIEATFERISKELDDIDRKANPERYNEDGTRKFSPPKSKQSGVIDQRILQAMATLGASEIARAGYKMVKRLRDGRELRASVEMVYNPLTDKIDRPGLMVRLSKNGKDIGYATFVRDLHRDNLYSQWTQVGDYGPHESGLRGKFYSKDIYEFAAELGNTIEPDVLQSGAGKGMWDKFQKKGIAIEGPEGTPIIPPKGLPPRGQRGMLDTYAISKGIADKVNSLLKKQPTRPSITPPERSTILSAAEGENRPLEIVKKALGTLQELPDTIYKPFKGATSRLRQIEFPGMMAALEAFSNAQMVYNHTKNDFVKYVSDFAANSKAQGVLRHEILTRGVTFAEGLWPKKVTDPNSPLAIWEGFSLKEQKAATDIINKYNGVEYPSKDQMRALGASERVIDGMERLAKPLRDLWEDINTASRAAGRKPIPFRPFYFMKEVGFGNWMVRVADKDGNTIAFHRADKRWTAEGAADQLRKQFEKQYPDLVVTVGEASRATKGNKFNVNTSLLEEVISALEKKDPRREAITSAIQDIKSKGGFAAHRAFRKDVGGMEATPQNFWKTYDAYIKDGSNYIANLEISKLINDLSIDKEVPPHLRDWSMNHLNIARGAHDPGAFVKGIEELADNIIKFGTLGQTSSGITRLGTEKLGKAFITSALLFGKPIFLLASSLQASMFSPAILSRLKYNQGYSGASTIKAIVEGNALLFKNDKEFKSVIDYLAYRGKLDPTLVSEIGLFSHKGAIYEQLGDKLTGAFLGRWAESGNRIQAAAMAHSFYKEAGLAGKDLKLAVERTVDDIMGNYSMTDKPGIVTKTGILGEGIKPLSTFKNFYLGTAAILAKEAAKGIVTGNFKSSIPFMTFFMSQTIMGGLMGTLGWAEVNWVFDQLKKQEWFQKAWKATFGTVLNASSPSLTERLLTSNMPDAATMGILTAATKMYDPRGMYISGSMTAPDVMPSVVTQGMKGLTPGWAYGVDLIDGISSLVGENLGGKQLTSQERKNYYKMILPSTIDSIINNIDEDFKSFPTTLGYGDMPVTGGKRGYGTVRRDNFETAASIIGGGTIPEFKERTAKFDIKDTQAAALEQKGRLVDMGVDDIIYGKGDKLGELIVKAQELGYYDYMKAVNAALMQKYTSESERLPKKAGTERGRRQIEYVGSQRSNPE